MRRIILWNIVTLDGYFQGREPWDLHFHDYVWGEEMERLGLEQLAAADALLFGRKTYEGMASYWRAAEGETADFMNRIRKYVFSRTLDDVDWNNAVLVKGDDAADEVARLKAQPGKDMLIFGSADFASTLTRHALIDEYRLGYAPVVLGAGVPLFRPGTEEKRMELTDVKRLGSCVIATYRPLVGTRER